MKLRAYQWQAVDAVEGQWTRVRSTLVVMATGTGKTVVMGELARRVTQAGGRVLFLAHRDELIRQAKEKLCEMMDNTLVSIESGNETLAGSLFAQDYRAVVASVQTMGKAKRREAYYRGYFTHVFIDEAHHSVAGAYKDIIDYFCEAKVLGVTATPDRADRAPLRSVFQTVAYEYGLKKAIEDHNLAPIRAEMLPLKINLTGVKQTKGDYDAAESGSAIEQCLEAIVDATKARIRGRHTLVFAPLIKTAHKIRDAYERAGFVAAEVDGKSPDRDQKIKAFGRGEIEVLCNAMLLTEGVDVPIVDCIIVLRPTKSRALYSQMVGRGTRMSPGKTDLLLLDFLWLTSVHNLCGPPALFCDAQDVSEEASTRLQAQGEAVDLLRLVETTQADVVEQREAALIKKLRQNQKKSARAVNPVAYAYAIRDPGLYEYQPILDGDCDNPTSAQLGELDGLGIDIQDVDSYGLASALLQSLIRRSETGMATPKQIRMLESRGYQLAGLWTKKEASYIMMRLSRNGWRVPPDIAPATYLPKRLRDQGYLS